MKKLPFRPTSKEELVREIQRLWDPVNPRDYMEYTERLTCKLEDIIKVRGSSTVY